MKLKEYISGSAEETKRIAAEFAAELKASDTVCMRGDLGAGKTAFVQGLAKGLGIGEYITSPTFTIVNVYESGRLKLYHFDVYRIEEPEEMYEIGYDEYIGGDGVCVIEWPQLIEEILPDNRYEIEILKDMSIGEDYRKIIIGRVTE